MPTVLAFVEFRQGRIRSVSYEVVTVARDVADGLGVDLHVVVLGADPGESVADLAKYGADVIHVGISPELERYNGAKYRAVVTRLAEEIAADTVVLPATALGRDLAPRVAARLDAGFAADCTAVAVDAGRLRVTRPRYAGKVFALVEFDTDRAVFSVRPNVFTPREKAGRGEVTPVSTDDLPEGGASVREVRAGEGRSLDVSEATIVVSGGRGLREPENFTMLEDLADVLGGAVGASRAVVDAGWRPHAEQVGQTGKTVAPQLYFAIGISGAIQHLAGMRTARYIVAINRDADAPIFRVADYGIVGDLFEVVPRLTEEIRRMKED